MNDDGDPMDTDPPAAAAAAAAVVATPTTSFPATVSKRLDEIDTDAAIARQLQEDEYSRNSFARPFRSYNRRQPPSTTSTSANKQVLTDAEYAAQLQEEEERNQRRFNPRAFLRPPTQITTSDRTDESEVIPSPPSSSSSSRLRRPSSDEAATSNPTDMSSFWQLLGPMIQQNFGSHRSHGVRNLENTAEDFGPDDYENLLELDNAVPADRLSEGEINRLPIDRFQRRATNNEEDNKCNICWDEFKPNEALRRLKCLHAYHKDCIDPWLKTSSSCPVCRVSTK